MKLATTLSAMILLLATLLVAADPEGFAMYTGAELKKRESTAKLEAHKVRADRVANWGNHSLLAIQREGDGEAELHDTQVDVVFVRSGEGTLVLGGTMVAPHTIAPGEIRANSIQGGVRKKMSAGDVFHIPAKIPHQMLVPKMLSFEVVKVDVK